ncbi:hypothetical protein VNO80_28882 [Phaseolus coccineus]|uniref:Uncharacterized protein n=1 Tax=Phaseolus coccineus TaxID=3886 RepID=A0AAN9QEE0_PHACN
MGFYFPYICYHSSSFNFHGVTPQLSSFLDSRDPFLLFLKQDMWDRVNQRVCRHSTISLSQRTIQRRILSCFGSLVALVAQPSLALPLKGPFGFKREEYNGSLPNLFLRPHSWTKVSSIILVDLPVSTGFAYSTTRSGTQRSDSTLVYQIHQFLRKFTLAAIPILELLFQQLFKKSLEEMKKGLAMDKSSGNAVTIRREDNYRIPFTHGMALISDELYESLKKNCEGEYINVDTRNTLCSRDMKSFNEAISGISEYCTLQPLCEYLDTETSQRRSLIKKYPGSKLSDTHLNLPPLTCHTYAYFLCGYWANDDNVLSALHIRKGSIGKWRRCTFDIPHKENIPDSIGYHVNLSRKGYRSLIYSGDHDMKITFLATQAWIRDLNYSIVDDWRPWYTNGQVAGYSPYFN